MLHRAYRRNYRRMNESWKKKILADRNYIVVPPYFNFLYDQVNALNQFNFLAETRGNDDKNDVDLYTKFYRKYPSAFNNSSSTVLRPLSATYLTRNAAEEFIGKQKGYMRHGYNEHKAFEMVEKDMAQELEGERKDRALIEGFATTNRARSLMSVFEQKAEYEARLKISRIQREIPAYLRSQEEVEENEEVEEVLKKYEPATCSLLIRFRSNGGKWSRTK